jgi:DNA-binding MarR family transcriptional regulator
MPDRPHAVDPVRLGAYFALIEVTDLLRHAIEQQLHDDGGLTFVRFQVLMRLDQAPAGSHRMTDLADAIVISRSGLTYQVGLLEKAGLVTRSASPGDDRSVTVTITDAGRALVGRVLPGHEEVVGRMLFDPLPQDDAATLARLLTPVRDHMRAAPPRSATARRRSGD